MKDEYYVPGSFLPVSGPAGHAYTRNRRLLKPRWDRSSHPSSNGGHLPLPPQGAQVPLPLLPLPPPLLRLPHTPLRPPPPRPRRRPPPRRPATRGGRRGGGVRLEALRVLRGGGLHTMLGQLEGDQGAAVAAAHGAPGAALPEAAAAVPVAPAGGVPDTGAVAEGQGHGEDASLVSVGFG